MLIFLLFVLTFWCHLEYWLLRLDFKVKILRNVPSDTLICSVQILIVIQPLSSTFPAVKGRVSCMPQLEVEFPARGRGFGHRRWCFFLNFRRT